MAMSGLSGTVPGFFGSEPHVPLAEPLQIAIAVDDAPALALTFAFTLIAGDDDAQACGARPIEPFRSTTTPELTIGLNGTYGPPVPIVFPPRPDAPSAAGTPAPIAPPPFGPLNVMNFTPGETAG